MSVEFGGRGDVRAFNAATCRRICLAPEALFRFQPGGIAPGI